MTSSTTSTSSTSPTATRPSLASALLQAWRTWHEHEQLLPAGPADTTRAERIRALTDLRAAPPET